MPYTEETINEIIKDFQNLLMDADNFSSFGSNQIEKQDTEYKQFWLGLRKEGPEALGLIKHLIGVLNNKLSKNEEVEEEGVKRGRETAEYLKSQGFMSGKKDKENKKEKQGVVTAPMMEME